MSKRCDLKLSYLLTEEFDSVGGAVGRWIGGSERGPDTMNCLASLKMSSKYHTTLNWFLIIDAAKQNQCTFLCSVQDSIQVFSYKGLFVGQSKSCSSGQGVFKVADSSINKSSPFTKSC